MDLIADIAVSGTTVLEEYARLFRKTFPEVLLQGGRGAVRHIIAITPPASADGVAGGLDSSSAARRRGYAAISRDLNRIFVPVRLKGKRTERHSLPDMVRIHTKHLGYKRPGAKMRRYGGPYYVDKRKFRQLEITLRSHVGRLAAGWAPAATALGVKLPSWIGRHGLGRGTYEVQYQGGLMWLEAVNLASAHAPVEELRRRVPYAVEYALNDMRRQITHRLERFTGFAPARAA